MSKLTIEWKKQLFELFIHHKNMSKFLCVLILILTFAFQSFAQSLLKDGKIPDDLLIILKTQGAWGHGQSETKIDAQGNYSFVTQSSFITLDGTSDNILFNGKKIESPKYLKPKLSEQKLKLLIAEFEKTQFLKFTADFPNPNEENYGGITDAGKESILIKINGQTKEVFYDLGDFNKRTKILKNLAEKIRGAGIWNYENEEIPENFQVDYRITENDKTKKWLKINAKGKITQTIITPQPYSIKVEKIGKLSKTQVKQLIDEFENIGFSGFRYSTLNKLSGCSNEPSSTVEKRKSINVQINHRNQMYASLYENCKAKSETDAAKFEYIVLKLEEIIGKEIKNKDFTF